jgi:hypothetical protein
LHEERRLEEIPNGKSGSKAKDVPLLSDLEGYPILK